MRPDRGRTDEFRTRHHHDCRSVGGRVLFSRGHGRSASLPRYPDATACAYQDRQSRSGTRRARAAPTGSEPARWAEADQHLAARAVGGRDGLPVDCACRAPRRIDLMPIATILELVLAATVLGLAVWTILARQTYAATVGFVAYGLLLPLIWVRLDAVDVALTEAAIGGGLGGVLLLAAAARLRETEIASLAETPGRLVRLGAAAISATIAAVLAAAMLLLPDPAPTLAPPAVAHAWATGLANPVTNVLMAFRAMDTMLEKVVLLLAIVGVWSLAFDRAWGGRPGPRHLADPHGPLAFLARLLP